MSYNAENYYALRQEFEEKHMRAIERAETRARELRAKIKELSELDAALSGTSARIMGAAFAGKEGLEERIARIKADTDALRAARAALLAANGYPADYTDVRYDCDKCKDTGFVDTKMCSCFKKALTLRGYDTSGIGSLIATQTFDSFQLDYYKKDHAAYERMKHNFDAVRRYAESFSPQSSGSLLFMGGTGLGKTHLSSALAKEVIDRGYDVLYDSAVHIFAAFENSKFRGADVDTARYLSVELLIMDDLGAELGTNFTASCLYDIINTRMVRSLPTLISTNLTAAELNARYGERIVSRLLGSYMPLTFCGEDVRLM